MFKGLTLKQIKQNFLVGEGLALTKTTLKQDQKKKVKSGLKR